MKEPICIKIVIERQASGAAVLYHPQDTLDFLLRNNAPLNTPHPQGFGIISTLLNYYFVRDGIELPVPDLVDGKPFRFRDGDTLVCRSKHWDKTSEQAPSE